MAAHLLAIDQGTTGTTALLLSPEGRVLGRETLELPQHFPSPGWVEHDADEIWTTVVAAIRAVYERTAIDPAACQAIGITNQRETTIVWDRATGRPIHRAIVWQDRRTAKRCEALEAAGHGAEFRARTGLVLDPYFSGTKIEWLLDHVDGARARAMRGELAFGTVDSWLVHRLSGGRVHVTDATNASRTLLFDLHSHRWNEALAETLRVPLAILPEVCGSAETVATTRDVPGLPDGVPVSGIAGDQQAALFGQTCFEVGEGKCTYGTGAFLLVNTGHEALMSRHGLVTTVAWKIGDRVTYALEGSAFIAGAAVQWLRDGLGIIRSSAEVEELARRVDGAGDVVFVPALAGLGAPYWDPHARGLLAGLTRDSNRSHVARAVLEGIAFQIVDLARAMEKDAGRPIGRLRVDGGASANDLLMQLQADFLGVEVDRPNSIETTALGAAYLAGVGAGVFSDVDAVRRTHRVERTFRPNSTKEERDAHIGRWHRAVDRARSDVES